MSAPGHIGLPPPVTTAQEPHPCPRASQPLPQGWGSESRRAVTPPAPHQEMLKYSKSCEGAEDLQEALSSILGILKAVNDSMHLIAITGYEVRLRPPCQPGAGPEGPITGGGGGLHAGHPESRARRPAGGSPGRSHPRARLSRPGSGTTPPGPPLLAQAAPDSGMPPLHPPRAQAVPWFLSAL